jgi:hypothetical protein
MKCLYFVQNTKAKARRALENLAKRDLALILRRAEQAALGAEAPPFARYPERGKMGNRANERNAYRLLQSLRFQQVYTVMMDALEDVCNVDVPAVRLQKCFFFVRKLHILHHCYILLL